MIRDSLLDERIWAAGFFDGEGTTLYRSGQVTTRHPYGQRQITLEVCQGGDREILERFARAVDVKGRIYGPYERGPRRKLVYRFQIRKRDDIAAAYSKLQPWLGPVKRAQAEAALDRFDAHVIVGKNSKYKRTAELK